MTQEINELLETTKILWNLNDLYDSIDDPTLSTHISQGQELAGQIHRNFSGKVSQLDEQQLLRLVTQLEEVAVLLGRISTFAYLNFATQSHDATAGAFLQKIREVNSEIEKELIFFPLEWARTPKDTAEHLLSSPVIAHYRHHLANIRRYQPHLLSEAEEVILLETAPVGRSSWTTLFTKALGQLKFGKDGRTEEEVLADLYLDDRKKRQQAARNLTKGLKSELHILTHTFNTLLAEKMIHDRIRHYNSWISSMNLDNELGDQTVQILIQKVMDRYDIPQRYYRIKRKLLGLPRLKDYDRYAPLPHLPDLKIPWSECRELVLSAFAEFSPKMSEIAGFFFDRQWIHAPLQHGKKSGAFAHPCVPNVHPYIMVNYTGTLRDVSTVAHELGHGVHQYLAAEQGYFNSSTPLVLAETASVFAELLVFNSQFRKIPGAKEQQAFIAQKLESIFATVFRQVAMNRFEDRVHQARRGKGELSSETISEHWLATQREMFGESIYLTPNYGIWWSYIPHFLSTPGYVYSYAFGELLVLSLYALYKKEGALFVTNYLNLLKSGGKDSPYELLRPFGVNLDDPSFWKGGLKIIDDMLTRIE